MNLFEAKRLAKMDPENIEAQKRLAAEQARAGSCACPELILDSERNKDGIPNCLDDYDWREAFSFAGDKFGGYGSPTLSAATPVEPVSVEPFGRSDICHIVAKDEG